MMVNATNSVLVITFFLTQIEITFLSYQIYYGSSDHFDISFKIVAYRDPKIWQCNEKMGSVAIETVCP